MNGATTGIQKIITVFLPKIILSDLQREKPELSGERDGTCMLRLSEPATDRILFLIKKIYDLSFRIVQNAQ